MNFNQLLLEGTDLTNVDNLLKALERGQISGVKKSDVMPYKSEKDNIGFFNFIIEKIEENIPSIYRNAAIVIFLKRLIETKNTFFNTDAYLAYFNNRNKKEAKTTYKQLFTDFENGKIKNRDFEKQVNELFKDKSTGKDESTKLYEDDIWLVVIPKTFAASCKYGENTKWCTTSSKQMFERYSKKSPLIIIINKKQNSESNPLAKVQLNKATYSYMDAKDDKIDIIKYLGKLPNKVQEILKKQGLYRWDLALVEASRANSLEKIKEALDNGADVHADNDYALINSAGNENIEIVKVLLDNGANIHINEDEPLFFASSNGSVEMIKLLLGKGATISEKMMDIAYVKNHKEAYKVLNKYMKKEKK